MIHNTPLKADPAVDHRTTVPPETDVHVQGLSHRRLSGRDTAPRRTMPSLQLPLHPLWKPRFVSALSTSLFLGFAFAEDTRRWPEDYTVCGDCRSRHHASCQVPLLPTATRSVLQVQRWVLTCDAARRASCWDGESVFVYVWVGKRVSRTGLVSI